MVIQGGQAKHSRRLAWAVARGWSSRFREGPVLPAFLGGFLVWGYRSSGEGGGGQDWGWQGSSFEWGGLDPGQRARSGLGRVCTMPKAEELWRCVLQQVPWWDPVLKWGGTHQGEGQCRFGRGLQRTLVAASGLGDTWPAWFGSVFELRVTIAVQQSGRATCLLR